MWLFGGSEVWLFWHLYSLQTLAGWLCAHHHLSQIHKSVHLSELLSDPGANINQSLSALGNVINALAEKCRSGKRLFVPFRCFALHPLLISTGSCPVLYCYTRVSCCILAVALLTNMQGASVHMRQQALTQHLSESSLLSHMH